MMSKAISARFIILSAIFAAAFLAFSSSTASADIAATAYIYNPDGEAYTLRYYDSNNDEVTDPTQLTAYDLSRNLAATYINQGKTPPSQSEVANLIQSGDIQVNYASFTPQNEYETGVPIATPVTLQGAMVTNPGGFDSRITGVDSNSETAQITLAAWNLGVTSSNVNTNPQTKDLPSDVRQQMIQSMQRVEAYQASQGGGGFFDDLFSFVGDIVSSAVDLLVCTTQDTIHAVGLRENGCGGGGGSSPNRCVLEGTACSGGSNQCGPITGTYVSDPDGTCICSNFVVPTCSSCPAGTSGTYPTCTPDVETPHLCPSGTTGVYPNCYSATSCPSGTTGTPPNCASGCSYNGSVSWGSGCSGSYSGTVQSGESVTVTNDASCRNGSATFTCSNGSWNTTGTPTCQASFLPLSCLISTATWSSWTACSGACGGGAGTQRRSCSTGNANDCSGPNSRTCVNNTACTNGNNNGNNGGGTGSQPTTQTTQSCTPDTLCSGSDVVARDSSCNERLVESCDYGCSGGSCDAPPPISFSSFGAMNFSGSFTASGHLQVRPVLVRQGDPTYLYWNVSNAQSCTVTGTNGDSWNTKSSGAAGKTTSAIQGQTTYTLHCTALRGATPPSITESFTVNITPYFQER